MKFNNLFKAQTLPIDAVWLCPEGHVENEMDTIPNDKQKILLRGSYKKKKTGDSLICIRLITGIILASSWLLIMDI